MKMFALLLTIWNFESETPYVPVQVFALETGVTGEDCIAAMMEFSPLVDRMGDAELSCVLDDYTPEE